jgi:hypothetical protein
MLVLVDGIFVDAWLVVIASNLFLLSKWERRELYAAIFQNSSTPGFPVLLNVALRLESHDRFIFDSVSKREHVKSANIEFTKEASAIPLPYHSPTPHADQLGLWHHQRNLIGRLSRPSYRPPVVTC